MTALHLGNLSTNLKMGFVYESVQPPIASTVMDGRGLQFNAFHQALANFHNFPVASCKGNWEYWKFLYFHSNSN